MLYDAHCHPTDDVDTLALIPDLDAKLCIMGTRFDDLEQVADTAKYGNVVPSFGLHPWYSYLVSLTSGVDKLQHYINVLTPEPTVEDIDEFPEPIAFSGHLEIIRNYIQQFPQALIGEVGLDKAFRVKLDGKLSRFRVKMSHQQAVLERQLAIAEEFQRPVSLHGVQAPSALIESTRKFDLPAVCLHSYSGSAEFYQHQWLKLKFPVYVSVATLINAPSLAKAEFLKAIPTDRVLSESDYHAAGTKMIGLLQASVEIIQEVLGWTHDHALQKIQDNFERFTDPAGLASRTPTDKLESE